MPAPETLSFAGMFARAMTFVRTRWLLLLGLAAVLGAGWFLRFAYYDSAHGMVDEVITVEVVRHLRLSGDWDVNWRKAQLGPDLRYDQYNFASHLYATYAFYRFVKLLPGLERWRSEREGFLVYRFFVALLACAAVVQALRLGRRLGGWSVGLGAALFTGMATLLVQDAHYVRPEAFTVVLTLAAAGLCLPAAGPPRNAIARALVAAFVVGVLIACKVSMAMLAWLPAVPLVFALRDAPRRAWWLLALPPALVAGFAAGAPHALAHPEAFRHGVQHLAAQYAWLHPPHSHYDPAPVGDMMLRYFGATLGWPMLVAFLIGGGVLLRARRWQEAIVLVGPVLVFGGYFATRSVFFERNLSHVVPLLCVVAAFGAVASVRALVALVPARAPVVFAPAAALGLLALAATPAWWSGKLIFVEYARRGEERHHRFEAALQARFPDAEWHGELYFMAGDGPVNELVARLQKSPQPVLIRLTDYRDERSARQIADLGRRLKMEKVAENPGTFPSLPTCTLLTYHSTTYHYFVVTGVRGS